MKVYGDIQSGNCYKIKLAMSLLDIDHEWIHVDILANETATAEFLLLRYPAIQNWLGRIAAHPKYVGMA